MKSLPRKCLFLFFLSLNYCLSLSAQNAWINEFHYDNDGGDSGEFVEVVIEDASSYDLSLFTLNLYNGSDGEAYDSFTLDNFIEGNIENSFTFYHKDISGIQNGPDAFSLDYDGTVLQFISYEGGFTAIGGPADQELSEDVGVEESGSTQIGESLQLSGTGSAYSDFTWQNPSASTKGQLNDSQILGTACIAPNTQASFAVPSSAEIGDNSVTLNWTRGNGDGLVILVKENTEVSEMPQNGISYTANPDLSSGLADEIGAGNFVVYDGSSSTASISGLAPGTEYHFAVFEYLTAGQCYLTQSETITVTTTTSLDADSEIKAPATQIPSSDIFSISNAASEAAEVFKFDITDKGTSDGEPTLLQNIVIEKSADNTVSDWSAVIKGAKLSDGTGDLTITNLNINQESITFDLTGNEFSIADGTTESITLSIWLEDTQTDGGILGFEIPESHGFGSKASGSLLSTPSSTAIISNPFTIEVEATDIAISTVASALVDNPFNLSATAVDANGNADLAPREINLAVSTGGGNLISPSVGLGPVAMNEGFFEWTDLQYDSVEPITIQAFDGNGLSANSSEIDIVPLVNTVFFSEYIEGSSSNKALEIFNNSGGTLNLDDFSLAIFTNGSESVSYEYDLSNIQADLVDQGNLVIANTSADSILQEIADTVQFSITNFNGDDALALLYKGHVIDVIGEIGTDPGTGWEVAGVSEGTQNKTLVRKAFVTQGNSTNLDSFGTSPFNSEWSVYDADDFSFLGSHFRCTPPIEQASAISIQNITENSAEVSWNPAVGLSSIVLIKEGSEVSAPPISGNSYAADADFSLAEGIGAESKIVFAGNGDIVNVFNLNDGTTYHVAIYSYDDTSNCFNLVSPTTGSFTTDIALDLDSEINNLTQPNPVKLHSRADQESESEDVLRFQIADLATYDNEPTYVKKLVFESSPTNALEWGNTLNAILKDENGKVNNAQVTISNDTIEIDFPLGQEYEILSGESVDFALSIWFNRFQISDTSQFALRIPAEHQFITLSSGSMLSDSLVEVIASHEIEIVESYDRIDSIRNGNSGETFVANGYVSSNDFGIENSQFYIQKDESSNYEHGIAVYSDAKIANLNQGNWVKVLGTKEEFGGSMRINADTIIVLDDEEFMPQTYPITPDNFNSSSELIGARVQLDSLILCQPDLWRDLAENQLRFTNGEDTVLVEIKPNNIYFDGNAQAPFSAVDLQGIMENHNDSIQLILSLDEEISDSYAPSFEIEPEVLNVESEKVDLTFGVDELSTVYYVLKRVEDAVPNFESMKNPENDAQIVLAGNKNIRSHNVGDSLIYGILGLASNTEYSIFVVAEDTLGNSSQILQSDFFTLNANADEDVVIIDPPEQISGNVINAFEATHNFVPVFNFTVEDGGTSDSLSTFIDRVVIHSSLENEVDFKDVLSEVQLYDFSKEEQINAQYSIFSDSIVFSLDEVFPLHHGASNTFQLRIELNESVQDEQKLAFEIPATKSAWNLLPTGSQLAEDFGAPVVSSVHSINVAATEWNLGYPEKVYQKEGFEVFVRAQDANGNLDIAERTITISTEGEAELLGQTELALTSGEGIFEQLEFSETGLNTFEISDGILTDSIDINFINPFLTVDTTDFNNDFGLVSYPENSTIQSYLLSPENLKDSLLVRAPEAFTLSLDAEFTIENDTLLIDEQTISPIEIFVKFSPDDKRGEFYKGDIIHLSQDMDTVSLKVSGQEGTLSLSTIELAKKKVLGERVKVNGVVIGGKNHFGEMRMIQDQTAGIAITGLNSSELNYGDSVKVEGVLVDLDDWTTIIPEKKIHRLSSDTIVVEPQILSISEVNASMESHRIRLENVDIDGEGEFEVGEYLIFDETDSLMLKLNTENHPLIGNKLPIGKVNVTGFIGSKNNEFQIYPEFAEDLEIIPRDTVLTVMAPAQGLVFGKVLMDEFSEPQVYSIQAKNLPDNLSISTSENFEISLLKKSNYSTQLVLPINKIGDIPKIEIYVRFSPKSTSGGEVLGEIAHVSGNQSSFIALKGIEEMVTSNQSLVERPISVYPNPVDTHVQINLAKPKHFQYQLLATDGEVVIEGRFKADHIKLLNISHLESGIYLLRLSNGDESYQTKILKN